LDLLLHVAELDRLQNTAHGIDHHFYTTVSVIRTMEDLLGLPPMKINDEFAPPIAPLFAGEGDQPPYTADYSNRDNGLIYQANSPRSPLGYGVS
jgi:hypothetical protein